MHIKRKSAERKIIMYLRTRLQRRAHDNLTRRGEMKYPGMRVTKGYIISELLMTFPIYIRDHQILWNAITESDIKEEGGGFAVNLNITTEANEKLEELKKILDKETGRSLFPAQIIDILLICAINTTEDAAKETAKEIPDKDLAKALMEFAFKLLTEETLSVNMMNAKTELISVLAENHLI